MALKIRMRQQGKKNRQTFRVVLIDGRSKRDGKYLENLGWYDPYAPEKNVSVNSERVAHWLEKGAVISEHCKDLMAKSCPEVIRNYTEKKVAKQSKLAAVRRGAKKKA